MRPGDSKAGPDLPRALRRPRPRPESGVTRRWAGRISYKTVTSGRWRDIACLRRQDRTKERRPAPKRGSRRGGPSPAPLRAACRLNEVVPRDSRIVHPLNDPGLRDDGHCARMSTAGPPERAPSEGRSFRWTNQKGRPPLPSTHAPHLPPVPFPEISRRPSPTSSGPPSVPRACSR